MPFVKVMNGWGHKMLEAVQTVARMVCIIASLYFLVHVLLAASTHMHTN